MNCQPLVPSISAEDGQWVVAKPFTPVCKPGGHGVIWKLAYDKGIFKWFYDHGRKGAIVRQVRLAINSIFNAFKSIIYRQLQFYSWEARLWTLLRLWCPCSNVVAATDVTLLALAGIGLHHGKVGLHLIVDRIILFRSTNLLIARYNFVS